MAKKKKYDKGQKSLKENKTIKPKVVKTVDTTSEKKVKATLNPTKSKAQSKSSAKNDSGTMLFSPMNYYIMLAGLGLIILGFILMSGGAQEANEWNDNVIYSARRITLAPIAILSGLGLFIYAIFKKTGAKAE